MMFVKPYIGCLKKFYYFDNKTEDFDEQLNKQKDIYEKDFKVVFVEFSTTSNRVVGVILYDRNLPIPKKMMGFTKKMFYYKEKWVEETVLIERGCDYEQYEQDVK